MQEEDTLVARIRRLEDLAEIERLIMDYRRHLDARDLHAYSRLFCEDGEWTGNTGSATGPDAIQGMLEERLAPNPPAPGRPACESNAPSSMSSETECGGQPRPR